MKMWAGGKPGRPDAAQLRSGINPFAGSNVDVAHMGVDCVQRPALIAEVMPDGNRNAIRIVNIIRGAAEQSPAGPDDRARTGGEDGRAGFGRDVHPGVSDVFIEKRAPVAVVRDWPVDLVCADRTGEIKMIERAERQWDGVLRRTPGGNGFRAERGQVEAQRFG